MDMFDFRQRNYMTPGGGNFGSNFGNTGSFGIQRQPTPFQGMEIQGPLGNDDSDGGGYAPQWGLPEQPAPYDPAGHQARMRLQQVQRARQPGPNPEDLVSQPTEQRPFTGMQVQGPLGSTPGQSNEPEPEPEGADPLEDKPFDIFEHMYNAPTPALEAYKRHIMSMPQQQDYKAGKMDRFIAALTGASEGLSKGGGAGYQAARGVVDQRYNKALQNYANQGQGLGQLAELESNDMKSKMSYAKTAMEQRRADMKELREGARDLALNKLTDMQTQDLAAKMKLHGLELRQNEKTGNLMVVNMVDGSERSLGQYADSFKDKETFKTDESMRAHKGNVQVDLGKDMTMAGVNFGNTIRGKNIDYANDVAKADTADERARNFELFKKPLEVEHAVNLFNATQPAKTAAAVSQANQIRRFAADNPILSSGGTMQPTQTDAALDYGIKRAALENPEFLVFMQDDAEASKRAALADRPLYDKFMALAKQYNDEAKGAAHREGGKKEPYVAPPFSPAVAPPRAAAPPIRQSPITAPSAPDDPMRAQAVELIKTQRPDLNAADESVIAQVIAQLKAQQGK